MSIPLPDRNLSLRVYRDMQGLTHIVSDDIRGLLIIRRDLREALSDVYGSIADLAAAGDKRAMAFMSAGEPVKI
jgi:hypothetical protein